LIVQLREPCFSFFFKKGVKEERSEGRKREERKRKGKTMKTVFSWNRHQQPHFRRQLPDPHCFAGYWRAMLDVLDDPEQVRAQFSPASRPPGFAENIRDVDGVLLKIWVGILPRDPPLAHGERRGI
jgi:hypothetical protein